MVKSLETEPGGIPYSVLIWKISLIYRNSVCILRFESVKYSSKIGKNHSDKGVIRIPHRRHSTLDNHQKGIINLLELITTYCNIYPLSLPGLELISIPTWLRCEISSAVLLMTFCVNFALNWWWYKLVHHLTHDKHTAAF